MRASSATALLISASAFLTFSVGCPSAEAPKPQRVDKASPFARGELEKDRGERSRGRPKAPKAREGEQLPEAEIEALLAKAAEQFADENVAQGRTTLGKCANKIPASVRCDGKLGLSMITARNRRAPALYYLTEAARHDDPKADAALYRDVGMALRKHGRTADAALALEKSLAREETAEALFVLGQVYSLDAKRVGEGADTIAKARAKLTADGGEENLDWLYEEAVLRGQLGIREEALAAAALMKSHLEKSGAGLEGPKAGGDTESGGEAKAPAEAKKPVDPAEAKAQMLRARIAELEEAAKTYPTREEYEKQQLEAAAPSPGETGPGAEAELEAPAPSPGETGPGAEAKPE
ncbi:hypothetical protein PPSIR1_01412 [Plesiocystis pacifica SIR-1]|uniref:Tetratricopeptide repeat protein n=1 Tax=Plesiocystis pacifica SIR-1 TaxID=391625 RepID=A6G8D3_9BACT|nr:hypothetical protein [Plesiocystis pacifica]EDM77843.1 hypothetical protein PPSIR1_01412 [Plesiocystis pacifica SIR-1]